MCGQESAGLGCDQAWWPSTERRTTPLVPGEAAAVCEVGGGRHALTHTTKTRERVAADQGAMIGLTYRCFELAAKCDPVIYAVDGLRRVANGQWLEG